MTTATSRGAFLILLLFLVSGISRGQEKTKHQKLKWLDSYHGKWIAVSQLDTLVLSIEYEKKVIERKALTYDGLKGSICKLSNQNGSAMDCPFLESANYQVSGPALIQGFSVKNRKKVGLLLKSKEGKIKYQRKDSSQGTVVKLDGSPAGTVQLELIEKNTLSWTILHHNRLVVAKEYSEERLEVPERLIFERMWQEGQ